MDVVVDCWPIHAVLYLKVMLLENRKCEGRPRKAHIESSNKVSTLPRPKCGTGGFSALSLAGAGLSRLAIYALLSRDRPYQPYRGHSRELGQAKVR